MYRPNSEGSALILVLLTLTVLSILSLGLFNMDSNHVRIINNDKIFQASYYFAEAGLQQQVEILHNHIENIYYDPWIRSRDSFFVKVMETPIIAPVFEDFEGKKVVITITLKKSKSSEYGDEVTIVSRCRIGNIKRSVLGRVQVTWKDPRDEDFVLDDTIFSIVEWRETR